MSNKYIGQATRRVDGRAKVTGQAKYAAEFQTEDLAYGVVVSSTIAKGKITAIDTSEALVLEGVIQVFTHNNVSGLAWFDKSYKDQDSPPGSPFRPLNGPEIKFSQQPIALVVAETFELASYAATLVKVDYETEGPVEVEIRDHLDKAFDPGKGKQGYKKPKNRGNFAKEFAKSDVRFETSYYHGAEHHNPMEMHASTVIYEADDHLTIYDKTQGVFNSQNYVTGIFGLSKKRVRIVSPFVGGAFGSGLRPQYQLFMATLAALELKRSVRVTLTRQQMFSFGHRPATLQKLSLGASQDGTLQALNHAAYSETSRFENYTETIVDWSGAMYKCDNVSYDYKLIAGDLYTPLDMRAPGAATGVYAIECAMDELAYKLRMDPVELRLKNYTEEDANQGKPYSSKELKACFQQGAEKFGWSKRNPEPRSLREGKTLIGWGMATGMWDAMFVPSRAKAFLSADGKLTVSSGTSDIGTGTYTIMTQIAAETLGMPMEQVTFKLGDSSLPLAYLEGGSATAASVGNAVRITCENIREKLLKLLSRTSYAPLADRPQEDLEFADGKIRLKADPEICISYSDILKQAGENYLEDTSTALPNMLKQMDYARNTHSAVFVEVRVDEDFGTVRVSRMVSAIAGGKILNPKTARSQILGGMVWGISKALEEESQVDSNFGRFMNHNYAEYHIPVNADIPAEMEVIFVEENDDVVNPMGIKGLGEIGVVGVTPAIVNAIFHATGKRIHELPVTLDKIIMEDLVVE
ncbi:xanthine dehydrogenase family protein molybdopterin-binding subunit [Siphonobacter sp. SORGH_AS_1065]|uniref:xanthine dehydrogenase family protein molybdopterin-binding subunit n=1 Tax=Siphonobacter sp. SORGH_AS_1065 TaxID=3041795 RepID=UPI002788473B|nr:xanthine dehydrogenase family protein molybdopterin-binding subunit [Siphonobacter sp. SORGH_AS_1065]MDQ1089225.1 xanthine dehydrogenase YagR molybdenum-binding subunit [Siphonobacter sp. SORGH_AS_1065]